MSNCWNQLGLYTEKIVRSHVNGYEPEIDWQALLCGILILCLMHVDHSFAPHITHIYYVCKCMLMLSLFIQFILSCVSIILYIYFCPFREHMILNEFKLLRFCSFISYTHNEKWTMKWRMSSAADIIQAIDHFLWIDLIRVQF